MFSYRSRSARALLGGVSGIALSVAGAVPFAVAQEAVNLDPITVVSTKPTRPARRRGVAPARLSAQEVRPASATPADRDGAATTAAGSRLQPTPDIMPATEVLGAVSTIRQNRDQSDHADAPGRSALHRAGRDRCPSAPMTRPRRSTFAACRISAASTC